MADGGDLADVDHMVLRVEADDGAPAGGWHGDGVEAAEARLPGEAAGQDEVADELADIVLEDSFGGQGRVDARAQRAKGTDDGSEADLAAPWQERWMWQWAEVDVEDEGCPGRDDHIDDTQDEFWRELPHCRIRSPPSIDAGAIAAEGIVFRAIATSSSAFAGALNDAAEGDGAASVFVGAVGETLRKATWEKPPSLSYGGWTIFGCSVHVPKQGKAKQSKAKQCNIIQSWTEPLVNIIHCC